MQTMIMAGPRQRSLLVRREVLGRSQPIRRRDPLRAPAIAAFLLGLGLLVAMIPGLATAPADPSPIPARMTAPAAVAPGPAGATVP